MTNFTWNNCTVPCNLKIKQVYGVDDAIIMANKKYKFEGISDIENFV